jgi:hypothetical protein
MQTNPAKELRLTQIVASLTRIDTNPAPPPTLPWHRLAAETQRRRDVSCITHQKQTKQTTMTTKSNNIKQLLLKNASKALSHKRLKDKTIEND